MDSSLPIMVTTRAGQIEFKRVVHQSAGFQLVFQLNIRIVNKLQLNNLLSLFKVPRPMLAKKTS